MKPKIIYSLFIFLLLLSSCANINTDSTINVDYQPKNPAEIIIFRSAEPDWRFQVIGLVTITGGRYVPLETLYKRMRVEAGKKGADAIIGFNMEFTTERMPYTQFICSAKIPCYPVTYYRTFDYYTATGTLVRKMEEGE